MERREEVVIVGEGIAGLATAVGLQRVGVRALVLEAAPALRNTTGAAIALFPNAWSALHALGVSHRLTPFYPPLRGGSGINVATGVVSNSIFSFLADSEREHRGPRGVHRKALLKALADELPADSIRFSSKLTAIEIDEQGLTVLRLKDRATIKSKVVIGCDGLHSVVAKWLGLSAPIDCGRSEIRGLSYFPQGHGLNQHALQYVGVGKRAGLIPLNDNEIYWFFVFYQGVETNDPEEIQKKVLENYCREFPSKFKEVVKSSDLSTVSWTLLTLRQPWNVLFGKLSKGNVTVNGDAMHPMTPEIGQGGCCSLEGAVVLSRHIGNCVMKNNGRIVAEEMAATLEGYVKERRWRAAVMIAGSYLSGWIQQGGFSWWMKILRDKNFYPFLARRLYNATLFDCGSLPSVKLD